MEKNSCIAVRGERKDVGQSLNKAILGGSSELRGWLYKRVHFFRGYRKHWFVLVNGTLSYYRKQTEESRKCRGSLFLRGSTISTSQNEVNFLVSNKHRTFDLRADSYNARCRWIKAIELAKTSLHLSHKGSTSFPSDTNLEDNVKGKGEVDSQELPVSIKKSWADTTAAAGLAASHNLALSTSTRSATSNSGTDDEFEDAMENPSLYDVLTVTAPPCYTSTLDLNASKSDTSGGSKDEDDECSSIDEGENDKHELHVIRKKISQDEKRRLGSGSQTSSEQTSRPSTPLKPKSCRQRRTRIPDKPDKPISLWNIVKNCIGKDLTKIPVPVNFSEPLSMIQRLTEDFEYSAILDRAATASDSCEQLAYVAAFTVSSYSTTAIRVGKPFNPLLGETFEYDRDDLGFRCVSEQVSHHPPIVAQFAESSNGLWRCWQEFSMRSKFKGKYLEVEPLGISHLVFENSGNHYSWRKVKTVVHNIVIGKLWVDQHGEMSVINHTNGDKCHMKFEPYSYFGGTPKKVTGTVITADDKVEWVLNGTWDSKLEGSKVISTTVVKGRSSLEIGPSRTLWKVNPIPPGAEKYYSFSPFACELNEMEEGVAPTDSRLRPDQRLMENGLFDEANSEKLRLEDKQRSVRREREEMAAQAAQRGESYEGYKPLWFKSEEDEYNGGKMTFVYNGGYWESKEKQDWGKCPDIF